MTAASGLKRQVASGFFWVAVAQFASRGLGYVTTLILAKLLAPSMFGLMGMAMLAINALALFQDIGFESALIYRRKDVDVASHTAFYTVIVTSVLITILAIALAPVIAGFFRQPEVIPLLQVLSLTVLITSFGRVPLVLLSRELDFRRRLFPELTASVVASIAAIVLAFRGLGVWSLVWREIIRAVLVTALVWFVSPYRPRWQFSRAAASRAVQLRQAYHVLAGSDLPDHERGQRRWSAGSSGPPRWASTVSRTTPPTSPPPRSPA
jgi:O-antigen/teichoic acid export membrane protein